jgi:hypothetical protein
VTTSCGYCTANTLTNDSSETEGHGQPRPRDPQPRQLAETTGLPAETLIDWVGLGILGGDGVAFPHTDIERARLVRFAVRRGNDPPRSPLP